MDLVPHDIERWLARAKRASDFFFRDIAARNALDKTAPAIVIAKQRADAELGQP